MLPNRRADLYQEVRQKSRNLIYTKIYNRMLVPLTADQPQAPPQLRTALATISHLVTPTHPKHDNRPTIKGDCQRGFKIAFVLAVPDMPTAD
jgi:hypothetical protein